MPSLSGARICVDWARAMASICEWFSRSERRDWSADPEGPLVGGASACNCHAAATLTNIIILHVPAMARVTAIRMGLAARPRLAIPGPTCPKPAVRTCKRLNGGHLGPHPHPYPTRFNCSAPRHFYLLGNLGKSKKIIIIN